MRFSYKEGDRINNFVLQRKISSRQWECLCDCGRVFNHSTRHMLRRKSCGCLSKSNRYAKQFDRIQTVWTRKYQYIKRSAYRRGIQFELDFETVKTLLLIECVYCGRLPDTITSYARCQTDLDKVKEIKISGIDRIDNTKGYLNKNCVSCCKQCNAAKGQLSLNEFSSYVELLNTRMNNANRSNI